ncbi:MAG: outer membrane beta-barrel protein [Candidatus Eisenbacteria sp.]|nr:outer membrane beta-barrel protein [Candidatus Eisenbacteria bacterium]
MARKLAVGVLMILMLSGPVLAQDKAIDFSLKGGVDWADLQVDPDPDPAYERLMRFGAGAALGFNIRPGFSLDTDVLYMMKGAKWEFSEDDYDSESEIKLDYIVINPMLRFAPAENGSGVYILGGGGDRIPDERGGID